MMDGQVLRVNRWDGINSMRQGEWAGRWTDVFRQTLSHLLIWDTCKEGLRSGRSENSWENHQCRETLSPKQLGN